MYLPPGDYREYYRISQDQSGKEVGVKRQQDDLRPLIAAAPGVRIVGTYVDPDVSATKKNVVRPEFERLLRDSQPGERVVCWHSDRFVRTTRDLLRIIDGGLLVHSLHAGHHDLSTPAGVATAKTQTAWAEYEGQQKALRQISSHKQRARAGRPFLGGTRPFGFDKVDGTYAINRDEAQALRKAYKMFIEGAKLVEIAAFLNGRGLSTSKGLAWNSNSVRQVLIQPRNAGVLTYNKVVVGPGTWEPIIDEVTFRAATRLLADPTRRTAGPRLGRGGVLHYLIGVAVCETCQGPTRVMHKRDYSLYQCRNGHASARSDWLENEIGGLILAETRRPLSERDMAAPDAGALGRELGDALALQAEYEAAHEAGSLTLAQFLKFNTANLDKIKDLERSMATVTLGEVVSELRGHEDLAVAWHGFTARKKAFYARGILSRIEILPRGLGERGTCKGKARVFVKNRPEPILAIDKKA